MLPFAQFPKLPNEAVIEAARMKAVGRPWEAIAARLQISVDDAIHIPFAYADLWDDTFDQTAEKALRFAALTVMAHVFSGPTSTVLIAHHSAQVR